MQREIGGPVAALPEDDPRRASFYQLHGLSNLLLSATAVGGAAARLLGITRVTRDLNFEL